MTATLETALPGVVIRALDPADAPALTSLIGENVAHLTQHGDYAELVAMDRSEIEQMLARDDVAGLYFGVFERERMVGVVCLVPVDPPRYGSGFWLAETASGRGLITESLRTLVSYARRGFGASDIFAGVTHGNAASAAVLERLGFVEVAEFDAYTRFHLAVSRAAT